MSPKWAFSAHFGDISYNVFNRKFSLHLKLETSHFNTIVERPTSPNKTFENTQNSHKFTQLILEKNLSGFGITESSCHCHSASLFGFSIIDNYAIDLFKYLCHALA